MRRDFAVGAARHTLLWLIATLVIRWCPAQEAPRGLRPAARFPLNMSSMKPDIRSGKLWVEEGPTQTAPLVTVAPVGPIDRTYTFTADKKILAELKLGQRVSVPIGKRDRMTTGYVIDIQTGPWTSTLKPIGEILDPGGQLSEHLLELGQWIARYYQCPLGKTLAAMMPDAARRLSGFHQVRYVRRCQPASSSNEENRQPALGQKQKAVIDELTATNSIMPTDLLLSRTGASRSTLRTLIARGLVDEFIEREAPEPPETQREPEPAFALTTDQRAALDRINTVIGAGKFHAMLLYGVSGSGKTEIYVHAMRSVIASGGQAILLVPEIALTTQLMQRLVRRFDRVAVIHSGLTNAQRGVMWEHIRRGNIDVVIGTRSAVFAPLPNCGLFVVDEEQETSYKNLQAPRFHVRDVAIKRAHMLGAPVLMGSATPSLELWQNAQRHPDYERIDLPTRVTARPMPPIRVVDMGEESARQPGQKLTLSRLLLSELDKTLAAGEQAVLLLNRRGYAQWLQCASCGTRVRCPRCNVQMVFHQARGAVICHQCHSRVTLPRHCPDPSCGGKLISGGCGTERLEQTIAALLPSARVRRADSDTMRRGDHYVQLVGDFEARQFDILVGTQMIAKGLDFPNVSLVGVIGAEPVGAASDFRSAEHLFQLITQVAGRAGRAQVPGRVVVQSLDPQIPALKFATNHDYVGFAEYELKRRATLRLPPYFRMARLIIAAKTERIATEQARQLAESLKTTSQAHAPTVEMQGPHPCALERRRDQYRQEILIRTQAVSALTTLLDTARHAGQFRLRGASIVVDVDPVNMT